VEAKMNDKKGNNGFDQLSREELGNATGGIPYEKPGLIIFSVDAASCNDGYSCTPGSNAIFDCNKGSYCKTGSVDPQQ
jgi:hypothetical protein